VLPIALEGYIILAKNPLKQIWPDHTSIALPHLVYDLSPGLHNPALGSQWILLFSLNKVLVLPIKEVLGELPSVREALDAAAHVTRVSEVGQANQALHRVLVQVAIIVNLELSVCLGRTLVVVEPLVLFHAVCIAVLYYLAFTDGLKNVPAAAPLANPNGQLLVFLEFEAESLIFVFSILDNNLLSTLQVELM